MENLIVVNADAIQIAVNTLKEIDVRGFDSMDKLVGLVMMFNGILANAQRIEIRPKEEPSQEEKPELADDVKGDAE